MATAMPTSGPKMQKVEGAVFFLVFLMSAFQHLIFINSYTSSQLKIWVYLGLGIAGVWNLELGVIAVFEATIYFW